MRTFFALLFAFMFCGVFAQENVQILDQISGRLPAGMEALPLEKVYVMTDKDVYTPGEIIWFNATAISRTGFDARNLGGEINVNLYDASGKFITGDRYKTGLPQTAGDLKVPEILPLGVYYLAAFSPLHLDPQEAFVKTIYIDQAYDSEPVVSLATPEKIYAAGTKAAISLKVAGHDGSSVDRFSFDYALDHKGKTIASGKLRSDKGSALIEADLPALTGNEPVILTLSHPKNLWMYKYALKTDADSVKVTFYPEGGNVVAGAVAKMGFYATHQGGNAVDLEADILDSDGAVVSKASTLVKGFGVFPFRMEPGKSYSMVITSDYGKGQTFTLPGQTSDKIALAVAQTDQEAVYIDLFAPDDTPRQVALAVTEKFNMVWAASFQLTRSARVKIPVADFDPGIQMITAFDPSGKVLASRLIYTPVKNQLSVAVDPVVENQQVRITVSTTNGANAPVPASLALTISDETRFASPDQTMQTSLMFNGELKNHVPDMAKLLNNQANLNMAIDYILIANELKRFNWDEILQGSVGADPDAFLAMKGIRGKVTTKRGDPVGGASLTMMNSRDMQMYTAVADEQGNFLFPAVNPVHISDFNINVTDSRGRSGFDISLEPSMAERIGERVARMNCIQPAGLGMRGQSPGYFEKNKDVFTKAPSNVRPYQPGPARVKSDSYKTLLQTATSLMEVIKAIKPYSLSSGQIVFPGTINSINNQSGALIVLDGQKMGTQADILNTINPQDVETINISLDPMDIQKYTGFNNVGVIEIVTKKGVETLGANVPGPVQEVLYQDGFRIPRVFLSTTSLQGKSGKDMRTTLLWNPDLQTDRSGKITFSVPVSQIRSGFKVYVEGNDADWNMGGNSASFVLP